MLRVTIIIIKCLLTISFVISIYSSSSAEVTTDSFLVYAKAQLDSIKEIKNTNLAEAIALTDELLEESYELRNDSLTNLIKFQLSFYHMLLNNQDESFEIIDEIIDFYQEKEPRKYAVLLTRIATMQKRKGNYDEAIKYLKLAEPLCIENDMSVNLGMINLYYSDINIFRGEFVKAYEYADEALQLFRKKKRNDFESAALTSMGYISLKLREYESAQSYFEQIFQDSSRIKNKSFLVRPIFYNGMLAYELRNYSKARKDFSKGLAQVDKLGNFPDLAQIYIYMAKIAIVEQKYNEANKHIKEAIAIAGDENIRDKWEAEVLSFQLNKQSGVGEGTNAKVRLAYDWAREHGDYAMLKETSKILAECSIAKGMAKEAYEYKSVYSEALANKISAENINKIALIKTQNDLEQEARLKDIEAEQIAEQIAANKKTTVIFMLSSIILFLMTGLLIYYIRLKNSANLKLREQNKALVQAEEQLAHKNRELEKYIESNIQLSQFAHIASHDLKSPLRTIGSFTGLLRKKFEKDVDQSSLSYLNFIEGAAGDLSLLVNDLLQFSKVNSLKVNIEDCPVEALIRDVLTINQQVIEEAGVDIKLDNLPPLIKADVSQLKQVFQNLITNAIKFRTKDDKPSIAISCKENGSFWEFSVKDNGIGIDDAYHEKIFEDFSRLHTREQYEGTGLGLSITKKIVEKHNGKIWVESTVGKGSAFKFRIPKLYNVAA